MLDGMLFNRGGCALLVTAKAAVEELCGDAMRTFSDNIYLLILIFLRK
jgi:hypothetical protein